MIVVCKRCGRRLKDPLSQRRQYGPTCWQKEGQYRVLDEMAQTVQEERIAQLEQELRQLKHQLAVLQKNGFSNWRSEPESELEQLIYGETPHARGATIPVMQGGWDIAELQSHPLFLKQQAANA